MGDEGIVRGDLNHYIIDLDDDDCPEVGLHLAAWRGDTVQLEELLTEHAEHVQIDSRVRPFLSSPLRLAATAGHLPCAEALLRAGAAVDCTDVKAQTPLFVALVNQHWAVARALLLAGADPNGSLANLCSPLSIMCQRGLYQGVKLLCEFGADTEDALRLLAGLPGLPVVSTATYHHLDCLLLLLLLGASPDLAGHPALPCQALLTPLLHAIVRYKCPLEYLFIYREFGGSFFVEDSQGRLATEVADGAPTLPHLRQFQETALSLQSLARLAVHRALGRGHALHAVTALGLTQRMQDFLTFRSWDPAAFDPEVEVEAATYRQLVAACGEVAADLATFRHHPLARGRREEVQRRLARTSLLGRERERESERECPTAATRRAGRCGPAPPPPPPAPRPRLLRFPAAEGVRRGHFTGYKALA